MCGHDLFFDFLYVSIYIEKKIGIDLTKIGRSENGVRASFLIPDECGGDDSIKEKMGIFGDVIDDPRDLDRPVGG